MNRNENPPEIDNFTRLAQQEKVTGAELKAAMQGYAASLDTVSESVIPNLIARAELSAEDLADIGERTLGIVWKGKSERAKKLHRDVLLAIEKKQHS